MPGVAWDGNKEQKCIFSHAAQQREYANCIYRSTRRPVAWLHQIYILCLYKTCIFVYGKAVEMISSWESHKWFWDVFFTDLGGVMAKSDQFGKDIESNGADISSLFERSSHSIYLVKLHQETGTRQFRRSSHASTLNSLAVKAFCLFSSTGNAQWKGGEAHVPWTPWTHMDSRSIGQKLFVIIVPCVDKPLRGPKT